MPPTEVRRFRDEVGDVPPSYSYFIFLAFGKLRMMQVVYAVIAHAGKTNPTHLGTTPTTLRDAD